MGTDNPSDCSRPEVGPEEEDLECPPSLEPYDEEFLGGEDGVGVGDSLQLTLMPEPTSTGALSGYAGVHSSWTCWPGGENSREVPRQDDIQEVARREWASF